MRFIPILVLLGVFLIGLAVYYNNRPPKLTTDQLLDLQSKYLDRASQADEFGTAIESEAWREAASDISDEIRKR